MSENALEIIPKDVIRTETVISRFPIHRLSNKGEISIDIKFKNDKGELKTKWEVTHNSKYGQPSPLAYKLDTLIINRKIEEAGKPVPELIRLGSLSEIANELGTTNSRNTAFIKKALLQNAFAAITAKFTYKDSEGNEKYTDIADTRYGVIFTGEKLPNGQKADVTYIQLHKMFIDIINSAPMRPLDYDYLKELTPSAQRFYELVSYQIYGALKQRREAKILYSDFCTYAPQPRYFTWEQVKKQMYKLHKPHLKSGYIESIKYEQVRDEDGTLDWTFFYTPGRKAKGELTFASRKALPRAKEIKSNPTQPKLIPDDPTPALIPPVELSFTNEEENLISKVRGFGVSENKARSLVKSHREAVEREIEYFPYRDLANAKNAAGLFIKAVTESYEPPPSYFEKSKFAETKKQNDKRAKEAEQTRKIQVEEGKARDRATERLSSLSEKERSEIWEMKKAAILDAPENQEPGKRKMLEMVIDGMIRTEIITDFINEERQNSAK